MTAEGPPALVVTPGHSSVGPAQTRASIKPGTRRLARVRSRGTPAEVREELRRYMDTFGLTYGAADFVISPDGTWTFLEVDPNGEWGRLADDCDLPIGESIAALLKEGHR